MAGRSERLKQLRIKAGKSEKEMADVVGIPLVSYKPLESYDDEIMERLSLRQVKQLAQACGISSRTLLLESESHQNYIGCKTFTELAEKIKQHLSQHNLSIEKFAEETDWYLEDFINKPELALDRPAIFLVDLCKPVGLNWLDVVPI
ncbi:MAG: helix-turn-helix transcriptional regulator [Proteobacteria bacterium]|nr:helix-turn-helix transcriptional regulator [Pseudomonadota bacterium]